MLAGQANGQRSVGEPENSDVGTPDSPAHVDCQSEYRAVTKKEIVATIAEEIGLTQLKTKEKGCISLKVTDKGAVSLYGHGFGLPDQFSRSVDSAHITWN